jgi:serine O-acetyltransferase
VFPIVEDGVHIYAGAVIAGGIVVGQNATIGANAVVLKDVPAGYLAVGVPAHCRPRSS